MVVSLAVSIMAFTLLLKSTTLLINVPASFWSFLSGVILIFFGIVTLFPKLWDRIEVTLHLSSASGRTLQKASTISGTTGNVLLGAALGPVFSSCSPTYALILATVLPVSLSEGMVYLVLYAIGLAVTLFILASYGQTLTKRISWAADPNGKFRRLLGLLIFLVGLSVITGIDKTVETWLLDVIPNATILEFMLLEKMQ